jgi:type VI secretion system secreted protein Hcp
LCRAGGDKVKYMEIKMEQVIISSVTPSGSAKGAKESFPTEIVKFNYGKIKWIYTQQKRTDGTGGGNVVGGWDLTANKVYS